MNKKTIIKHNASKIFKKREMVFRLIEEFFEREYDHYPDFSDSNHINIGTTEFEFPKNKFHDISIEVSLDDYALRIYIDNIMVHEKRYDNIDTFIDNELTDPCLDEIYDKYISEYIQKHNYEEDDDNELTNNRTLAVSIIHVFEDFLSNKGIDIPNPDKTGDEDEAIIYGEDYYYLEDTITNMLNILEE